MPDQTGSDDAGFLRHYLSERDVPCPGCGYNLRGLTADGCPECNQRLLLRVGLSEPRLGPWIAAMAGFLSSAGAGMVALGLVAILSARWGFPSRKELFPLFWLPMIMLVVAGGAARLLGSTRGRSWFRRSGGGAQRAVIGGAWLLVAVFVAVFVVTIR